MLKKDCIFCKIIRNEIPSYLIYQDENVCAFLDVSPITEGHTIIIPKTHNLNLLDFDDEKIAHFFQTLKNLANRIKIKLGADGFNILQNNFTAAGQVVDHMHYHIIPRYYNDNLKIFNQNKIILNKDRFQEILNKINKKNGGS